MQKDVRFPNPESEAKEFKELPEAEILFLGRPMILEISCYANSYISIIVIFYVGALLSHRTPVF